MNFLIPSQLQWLVFHVIQKNSVTAAFKELKEKGMKIIPVNPMADEIMGEKSYPNVKMLPPEVQSIIIMTKKDTDCICYSGSKGKGIKQIWIQQMADSKEAFMSLRIQI